MLGICKPGNTHPVENMNQLAELIRDKRLFDTERQKAIMSQAFIFKVFDSLGEIMGRDKNTFGMANIFVMKCKRAGISDTAKFNNNFSCKKKVVENTAKELFNKFWKCPNSGLRTKWQKQMRRINGSMYPLIQSPGGRATTRKSTLVYFIYTTNHNMEGNRVFLYEVCYISECW